jgi:trk system potassium uptake protein TrkH
MKLPLVASVLGIIITAFGCIIVLPAVVACIEGEYWSTIPFLFASGIAVACGNFCRWYGGFTRNFDDLKRTEGLLIVVLTWILCGVFGAIPYLFFNLSFVDALFESVSGITTTGSTILTDFTLYSKTFFFWRSLSQWLGGMGIIVLFVAILSEFGIAGRKIFFTEAPGPREEKITPRVAQTAKALWLVYLLLTCIEIIALGMAGMDWFDALCNSMSTMAAGGFSPHPQSIKGYQNNAVTWIVILFMFLAGSNFALQYRMIIKRQFLSLLSSEEFQFYFVISTLFSLGLFWVLYSYHHNTSGNCLRDSVFQIVSIITTTGFCSADFALWAIPAQALVFAMMLVGGCAGSAGGGVKVVRVLFMGKFLKREIDQIMHPSAVFPIKIDRTTLPDAVQRQMLSFLLFYLVALIFSGLTVAMIEQNVITGLVGTAATIGNVGPGFGEIGPLGSYGNLHTLSKLVFIIDMLVGRLELIPFFVMLSPEFWVLDRS